MVKTLSVDLEKSLDDETIFKKFQDDLVLRLNQIDKKIFVNTECKEQIILYKSRLAKEIDDYIQSELARVAKLKKREIHNDLENIFQDVERNILASNQVGIELKQKLELESKNYQDAVVASQKISKNIFVNNLQNIDEDLDFDEVELTLNETTNEFSEPTVDRRKNLLENVFRNIDQLTHSETKFLTENYQQKLENIEFVKRSICHENLSFGNLKSLYPESGIIDPIRFRLDTVLNKIFFEKGKDCLIQFSYPFLVNDNHDKFSDNLTIEMIDSDEKPVITILKEKLSADGSNIHFFLYFKPNTTGLFKLKLKFKKEYILESPLIFAVVSLVPQTNTAAFNMNDTNSRLRNLNLENNQSESQIIFNRASLPPYSNLVDTTQNDSFEKKFSNSISVGRGRLLKNLNKPREINQSNNYISLSLSQKRKSPSYQPDSNNNQIIDIEVEEEEGEDIVMKETSSKIKKSDVMYSAEGSDGQRDSNFQVNVCILSNHLRKYTRAMNSFSLLNETIPSLQAKFVGKYTNLSYPIGVRVCLKRNWLIVCDCGNNEIKFFDRNTTNLIKVVGSSSAFNIERPSALLIDNETGDKLYVKDDKQIMVFDLSNNCNFIRKFGLKILQKPYGLTFNKEGHLIVVDTNARSPVIHIFNKATGELMKSSPYQPAIFEHAKSSVLNSLYYDNKADLIPFDKSKIRFIDCFQNYIYASDLGRSIVFKTTLDGKTELAFGTFGKTPGQMNEPSGIHVDYDGKAVLVGDSKNNRLQIFDDQGKYKCDLEFIDEKIIRPSDIHIDAEGYLYVVCFIQHCIKKFKLI